MAEYEVFGDASAAGGKVVFDGYFNHRVFTKDGKGGAHITPPGVLRDHIALTLLFVANRTIERTNEALFFLLVQIYD